MPIELPVNLSEQQSLLSCQKQISIQKYFCKILFKNVNLCAKNYQLICLSLLKGKDAHIHEYQLEKSEVFHCLSGQWEIQCDGEKAIISERDTFSAPKNSTRSVRQISDTDGSLFLVRQTN